MNIRHKVIDQENVDAKDAWGIDIKSKKGKLTSKAVPSIKTFNFIYFVTVTLTFPSRHIYMTTINPFMVLSQC